MRALDRRHVAAVAVVLAVVASACGDDGGDATDADTAAPTADETPDEDGDEGSGDDVDAAADDDAADEPDDTGADDGDGADDQDDVESDDTDATSADDGDGTASEDGDGSASDAGQGAGDDGASGGADDASTGGGEGPIGGTPLPGDDDGSAAAGDATDAPALFLDDEAKVLADLCRAGGVVITTFDLDGAVEFTTYDDEAVGIRAFTQGTDVTTYGTQRRTAGDTVTYAGVFEGGEFADVRLVLGADADLPDCDFTYEPTPLPPPDL